MAAPTPKHSSDQTGREYRLSWKCGPWEDGTPLTAFTLIDRSELDGNVKSIDILKLAVIASLGIGVTLEWRHSDQNELIAYVPAGTQSPFLVDTGARVPIKATFKSGALSDGDVIVTTESQAPGDGISIYVEADLEF